MSTAVAALGKGLTCLAIASLVAIALLGPPLAVAASTDLETLSQQELERIKLAEEIEQLGNENDAADGWSGAFADYAPLLTALVAVGGLIATFWKQSSDQSLQRTRDREQREVESDRRLEDRFNAILTDLGSEAPAAKAGAAASLVTYLEPQHTRFHHQVRLAVLTNLKLGHEEPIRKLLARVYVQALRSSEPINPFELDLSRAKLANTDLSDVDLPKADLAFADLTASTLVGSNLFRARGREVVLEGARLGSERGRETSLIEVRFRGARCRGADFSGAILVNAHLEDADLRAARFFKCRLQAAHLENAKLAGAEFQQANLADAYFIGAELDADSMWSISRARNWRKAHFDTEVYEALERLADQAVPPSS